MVVAPAVLYSLPTAPLTAKDLERLAVTQRKMIRSIVGWVKLNEDDWADMYRRLGAKVDAALQRQPVRTWVEALESRKEMLRSDILHQRRKALTLRVATWDPQAIFDDKLPTQPKRKRGRPRTTR